MSTASPITIAGATTGKTYTCTVKGHNARGYGLASVSSGAVVVGAPAKPAQPVASSAGAGKLRLSFTPLTAGATNGSPLTAPNYTATCISSDGGVTRSATGAGSPITVTGLTVGKSYRCNSRAHNARGYSPPSLGSSAMTA